TDGFHFWRNAVWMASITGWAMPLFDPTESPVWRLEVGQTVPVALAIAVWRVGGVGVAVPVRLTHAAVLLHGGARHPAPGALGLLLLVMNVIETPHPSEVGPAKGQLPTPMGNRHALGGGVSGGLAIAMACPAAGRPVNPNSRRNVVGIVVW